MAEGKGGLVVGGFDVSINDPEKIKGATPLHLHKEPVHKLHRTSIQESFLALQPEERQAVLQLLGVKADGTGHIIRNGRDLETGQPMSEGGILLPGGTKEKPE